MSETKYYSRLFDRVDSNEFCRLFETRCKCGAEHLYSVKEETDGLKIIAFFICPECGRKFKKVAVDFGTTPTAYNMSQFLVCCFKGKKGVYHGVYRSSNNIAVIMQDRIIDYPAEKLKLIGRHDGMEELHNTKKPKKGGKR